MLSKFTKIIQLESEGFRIWPRDCWCHSPQLFYFTALLQPCVFLVWTQEGEASRGTGLVQQNPVKPLSWGPLWSGFLEFQEGNYGPAQTHRPLATHLSSRGPRRDYCSLESKSISNKGSIIFISVLTASCKFKSHLFNEGWLDEWIQEKGTIVRCHVFSLLGSN